MAYKMSRLYIKRLAKAQIIADCQQQELTFRYSRCDDYGRPLSKGAYTFTPGSPLMIDILDVGTFDAIADPILEKYSSAINGQISHFDSVLRLEKQIAHEIVEIYRDKFKKPDGAKVEALEKIFGIQADRQGGGFAEG